MGGTHVLGCTVGGEAASSLTLTGDESREAVQVREAARTVEAAQTAANEEKVSLAAREQAVREKEVRLAQELKPPSWWSGFAPVLSLIRMW